MIEKIGLRITSTISSATDPGNTVFALTGVGGLYGVGRVSDLISAIEAQVVGRLLCFFPGQHSENSYRFLDARDGWNYLAVPITSEESIY